MAGDAYNFDEIPQMADEVSRLMISRLGGAKRGEQPTLMAMLRRRGAALPRRLRRDAHLLAKAQEYAPQPRIARQQDMASLGRAHRALIAHLQPLGEISRWQGRAVSFAASVAFGLLVLGALIVWVLVLRGHI